MISVPAPHWFADDPEAWRLAGAAALLRKWLQGSDGAPFGAGFAACLALAALSLAFADSLAAPIAVFALSRGACLLAAGFAAKASLRFAYNARWSLRSGHPALGFADHEMLLEEASRAPELSPDENRAAQLLFSESGGYGPFAMHDRAFYKRLRSCYGPVRLNLAEKALLAALIFPLRAAARRQCPAAAQAFLLRACPKLSCFKQRSLLEKIASAGAAKPSQASAL